MNRSYSLKRAEIEEVIKNGAFRHFPFFSCRLLFKTEAKRPKAAFVAAKKVFPTSPLRNKAKRRAREAFRHGLLEKKGHMVFFLKKEILKADFKDLKNEFSKV